MVDVSILAILTINALIVIIKSSSITIIIFSRRRYFNEHESTDNAK